MDWGSIDCRRATGLGCSMPERVRRASLVLAVGTPCLPPGRCYRRACRGACGCGGGRAVLTVGNYPVEARADNAVAVKDRAPSEGQQPPLLALAPPGAGTAFQRLKQLPAVRAGDLLEGVKVRAERNSATDYIASLDFSFQSKGVRDLLRREGIPFTDEQAPVSPWFPFGSPPAARPRPMPPGRRFGAGLTSSMP